MQGGVTEAKQRPVFTSFCYHESIYNHLSTADAKLDIIKQVVKKNQCNYFELKIFPYRSQACM